MTKDPIAFADLAPEPRNHYSLLLHGAIARVLAALDAAPAAVTAGGLEFVDGYRVALTAPAPPEITANATALVAWWRAVIDAWEQQHSLHLPLLALEPPLDTARRIALLVPALVDEDARFGTLVDRLQGGSAGPWPRVQWLGQLFSEGPAVTGVSDPWSRCRPLVDYGLLQVLDTSPPRGHWALRVPPLLLDALRGELQERPAAGLRLTAGQQLPELVALILPEAFRAELTGAADLLASGALETLVLRGGAGETPAALAGAVARRLGRGLLTISPAALAGMDGPSLSALCALARALPLVVLGELDDTSSAGQTPLTEVLPTPSLVTIPLEASLPTASGMLVLEVPELDPDLRRRVWAQCLAGVPADLDRISERFVLSAGHIPALARAARNAGESARPCVGQDPATETSVPVLGVAEVRRATADLNHREIGPYADRLPTAGSWSDLITSETTRLRLLELERRCRYRERLTAGLGPGFANSTNRGVRALLSGPSGTGKTLAAKLLAAELGLDLYRVDLAAVVNKYIGETEKNLKQVLGRAECLDLVLLLDEGDALLGSRTEVRSSNDRYANLQTNYLLQRLEHYQGILVVTTNLGNNIDSAFKRRMDVVVPFQPPEPVERLDILALHLPSDHAVSRELLEQTAVRCALNGGQLRNAVLLAGLLALNEGVAIGDGHLHAALRSEYRKAGAAFPLEGLSLSATTSSVPADWDAFDPWNEQAPTDPLDGYLNALANGHA